MNAIRMNEVIKIGTETYLPIKIVHGRGEVEYVLLKQLFDDTWVKTEHTYMSEYLLIKKLYLLADVK